MPNLFRLLPLLLLILLTASSLHAQAGNLDTTFGNGGKVVLPLDLGGSWTDIASDVAIQFDGKIVIGGWANVSSANDDFVVLRLFPNGSLDTGFGNAGLAIVNFDSGQRVSDHGRALAIQGDGKIVVVGETMSTTSGDIAVARLTSSGVLDSTFGTGGKTTIVFDTSGQNFDTPTDILLQPDGKIVVTGHVHTGSSNLDFGAARLTVAGALDSSFGTGGKKVVSFDLGGLDQDECWASVLQSDGKIVLVGTADMGGLDRDFAVARLLANGALDPSFGTAGKTTVPFNLLTHGADYAFDVVVDSTGRIVLAGWVEGATPQAHDFGIVRLQPDGTPDPSFSTDGKTTIAIDSGWYGLDQAHELVIGPGGKILVAGRAFYGINDIDFALARLHTDGSLDTAFGNGGKKVIPFDMGGENADYLSGMAIQLTGQIVLVGYVERASPGDYDWAVTRVVGDPFFTF